MHGEEISSGGSCASDQGATGRQLSTSGLQFALKTDLQTIISDIFILVTHYGDIMST